MSETIQLREPITVDGTEVHSLTVRRPKVRDQILAEKAEGSEAERELTLFSHLCEVPTSALQELDMADYQELQGAYMGFFGSAPGSAGSSASS